MMTAVFVGPPHSVEIDRDPETGVVGFEMYDEMGFCCGGCEFHPDGTVVWTLLQGDCVKSGKDAPS